MGLYEFAANLGERLFGSDQSGEDASKKIQEKIQSNNPGIEELSVEMIDGGKVALSGKAKSAEALEKAVLMAGNIQGVEEVDATAVEAPSLSSQVEYYVIQKGDTLSGIASEKYGDAAKYQEIFTANREVIGDPNKIYPGQKIRLPQLN